MDKYYNKKVLNINDYLDEKDFELLERLHVKIVDNSCTEYEFDIIKQQLLEYYSENIDESPEGKAELKKYLKSLEDVSVSQEEYDKLVEKFDKIHENLLAS